MTIRQLHYTSCRQGRDGINGFQVAAGTPGLAARHERLALPLAAYRPTPDSPATPTAEQVAAFPVALGYRRFDDVAVLFHSRYVGADFTGRQGNYFAHILVLDRPEADLAGLLPPEAWASSVWTWQWVGGPELPVLERPPSGPLADRVRVHAGLARVPAFPAVLDAVIRALQGGPRLLLVAPDVGDVATVLAAVARSLPAPLAHGLSFTTFSATPADTDLLVVGTTPDVARTAAAHGGRVVIRLDEPPATSAPYAALAGRCWAAGPSATDGLVALAEGLDPPLQPGELDAFAPFAQLRSDRADAATALGAVEFAGRRYPAALNEELWRRVDAAIPPDGALDDVARWSSAVHAAGRPTAPGPGPAVESAYLQAVLAGVAAGQLDPAGLWLPRGSGAQAAAGGWAATAVRGDPTVATAARVLVTVERLAVTPSDAELREIVDLVVIPQLVDPSDSQVADRIRELPHRRRLLSLAADQLEPRLADGNLFDAAARGLSVTTAELLLEAAPPGSRCAMVARLALARDGRLDRITTLREVVGEAADEDGASRLGWIAGLIWPDPPSAGEATAICRSFLPAVVAQSGLPTQLARRLVLDTREPAAAAEVGALARSLSAVPIMEVLDPADADVVRAARLEEMFRDRPEPSPDTAARAVEAARLAERVEVVLGERLAETVAAWLLTPQPTAAHAGVLRGVVTGTPAERFLTRYGRRLRELLTAADPQVVAAVLPAVAASVRDSPRAEHLLRTVCVESLRQRRKRDLDQVGRSLELQRGTLASLAPPTVGGWPAWWEHWRAANVPGSVLGGLRAGLQRRRGGP